MGLKLLYFLLLQSSYTLVQNVQASNISRIEQSFGNPVTAEIFEFQSKVGKRFNYFDYMESWNNLKLFMRTNELENIGLICVTGIWIGYNGANFISSDNGFYRICSGVNQCVRPSKLHSIQPIGSLSNIYAESLTTFQYEHFGGISCSITAKVIQGTSLPCHTNCRSVIIVGNSSWSLRLAKTKDWICIKVETRNSVSSSRNPSICVLPSINQYLGRHGINTKFMGHFNALRKGCAGNDEIEIVISNCFTFGEQTKNMYREFNVKMNEDSQDYLLHSLLSSERNSTNLLEKNSKTRFRRNTMGCGKGGSDASIEIPNGVTCTEICEPDWKELILLLRFRITHDFSSPEQLILPMNRIFVQNTAILDHTFDIFIVGCPQCPVQTPYMTITYLQILREISVYLLEKEWFKDEASGQRNYVYTTDELKILERQLTVCRWNITTESVSPFIQKVMQEYVQMKKEIKIHKDMEIVDTNDIVIESIWAIVNFVATFCHNRHRDIYPNFWIDFLDNFEANYLKTLVKQWKTPGFLKSAYKFVLGGFNLLLEYKKIALCSTIALNDKFSTLEIFQRSINSSYLN